MKAELKTITPEWAKRILEKNTINRCVNRKHLEFLIKEIQHGRWKLNGDTICMNDQHLIDGQHRLMAVVESGIPIKSLVVDGLPSDVFDTKDTGKRRSGGDTLGVMGEVNACRLAACLAMVDKYMTGRAEKNHLYSNSEIQELLLKYPDVRSSIQSQYNPKGIIPCSVLDSCHYLFSQKDPCLADEFVEKVVRGLDMNENSPWYSLRERLMKNNINKAKLPRPHIMALCIKAWNRARTNRPAKVLRWRDAGEAAESFPVVI